MQVVPPVVYKPSVELPQVTPPVVVEPGVGLHQSVEGHQQVVPLVAAVPSKELLQELGLVNNTFPTSLDFGRNLSDEVHIVQDCSAKEHNEFAIEIRLDMVPLIQDLGGGVTSLSEQVLLHHGAGVFGHEESGLVTRDDEVFIGLVIQDDEVSVTADTDLSSQGSMNVIHQEFPLQVQKLEENSGRPGGLSMAFQKAFTCQVEASTRRCLRLISI